MSADLTVWKDLHALATSARRQFRLRRFVLEPVTHPRTRVYGDCDLSGSPRVIRLRVHRLDEPRRPLAARTLRATLAHELAHLREPGHGGAHRALERAILAAWATEKQNGPELPPSRRR